MSLCSELAAAGIPVDHHESDLYVKDGPAAREILSRHAPDGATRFTSQVDGQVWVEVPFAYEPFWDARDGTLHSLAANAGIDSAGMGRAEIRRAHDRLKEGRAFCDQHDARLEEHLRRLGA